jgi:Skp family chaperone for outer membrane proteins
MQFQDNEAIAAQADKLAADRHDLYQKIVDQVQAQITQIAQKDGVAIVFTSIRGAGTAVDLTAEVRKAINSSAGVASQPVPTSSGGS